MDNSLFRREVLDAYTNRWIGDSRHGIRISSIYIAMPIVCASLLVLVVIFACSYSARGTVQGQIVPKAGILQLTSTLSGRVVKILRGEGARVEKGDTLFIISSELKPTTGIAPAQMIDSLKKARERTDLEVAREIANQSSRREAFDAKGSAMEQELTSIRDQISAQNRLLVTSGEILSLYERSGSVGIVAGVSVAERRQQLQQQRAQLAEYERQLHEKQSSLAGLQLDRVAAEVASTDKVMKLRSDLDGLDRQLLDIESSREVSVVAPAAGIVSAVQATPGQAVTLGQVIGTLLPNDSELIAVALVPSKFIAQVKVGTSARVRLDSFPYLRFGTLSARVADISQGPVPIPSEESRLKKPSEESYKLEFAIPQVLDGIDGLTHELRPGMTFSAILPLERHRVYEWILPRLIDGRSAQQISQ